MTKITFTSVAVVTIDGKIAKNTQHNVDWSSKEDKAFLNKMIKKHDVIIVGRNTFNVAKKALTKKEFLTRNYIVFTRNVKTITKESEQVTLCNPDKVNIKKVIAKMGYRKVCILGGAQIYSLMLRENLTDEIYLTIEPKMFGSGINFVDFKISKIKKFKLNSVKKLNDQGTILLHYHLDKN